MLPEQVDILIKLVSINPFLYDKRSPEYKKVEQRKHIWKQIAVGVGANEQLCRDQWRSLKDQFVRYMRNSKDTMGQTTEQKRTFKHYEKLLFLKEALEPKSCKITKLSSDQVDVLIDLISKNPCLYDKRDLQYKKLDETNKVWRQIASLICADVKLCRLTWRSLMDQFQTHVCTIKNTAQCKQAYEYYDKLQFLEGVDLPTSGGLPFEYEEYVEYEKSEEVKNETSEYIKENSCDFDDFYVVAMKTQDFEYRTMTPEQVDILIKLVSINPCLYDKRSPQYRKIEQSKKIWKRIAAEVGANEQLCRSHWRSLKDQFRRYIRALEDETGQTSEQKRTFKHYQKLIFLKEVMEPTSDEMNKLSPEQVDVLINLVEKSPCLYNRRNPQYKKLDDTNKLWKKIATRVRADEKQCRLAWRSLKDQFQRYNKFTMENTTEYKRVYKYYDKLQFLKGVDVPIKGPFEYEEYAEYDKSPEVKNEAPDYSKEKDCDFDVFYFDAMETSENLITESSLHTDEDNKVKAVEPTHYTTPRNAYASNKNEERVNAMSRSLNAVLRQEIVQQSKGNSPNEAYLTVLDEYLLKLPADEQDKIKVEVLNLVLNKIKAERK